MSPSNSRAPVRRATLAALLAAGTIAGCAYGGPAGYDQVNEPMESSSMSDASSTTVEGEGAHLEAAFEASAGGPLRVRYQLRNTGDLDLAVFDRGNRHAVLTKRQNTGEVGQPTFREEGDGDVTVSHIALPLPQPSPTLPPTPLAAKLAAGQTLEGGFTFAPLVAGPMKRIRWCLGVAAFDEPLFHNPEQVDGVEIWQASFTLADGQQVLCTPWFDVAAGAFEAQ